MLKASSQPIALMTTEVQVPLFPLQWRCKTCRLHHTHPQVFDELTRRLIEAQPRKTVLKWLAAQGVKLSEKLLAVHYQRHLLPYFSEALEVERRLKIEHQALGHTGAASIASALARSLAMRGLAAVETIDFAALGRKADPKLIEALSKLAQTIASIDALSADARLKEKLVELRAIDLTLKRGELEQAAVRWLKYRLEEHPEIAARVFELIEPIMPHLKALPAPNDDSPTAQPRAQRPQKRTAKRRA